MDEALNKLEREIKHVLLLPRAALLKAFVKQITIVFAASLLFAAVIPSPTNIELLRFHIALIGLIILVSTPCILLSPVQRVRRLRWAKSALADLTTEQKLYVRVCILFIIMILLVVAGVRHWGGDFLVGLSLLFMAYVAARDVLRWYRMLSESVLGKAAIALGFAAASSIAYGLAGQRIADVIHVTPTNFSHTNLLVAIMTIPLLITLAGAFFAAIGLFFSSVLMALVTFPDINKILTWLLAGEWQPSKIRFARATLVFQSIFFALLGIALYAYGQQGMGWYAAAVERQIPALVYKLDMYHGRECALEPGSKLAPLGDGRFLIATKMPSGELHFPPPVTCGEQK